jgi:hypothetical protein
MLPFDLSAWEGEVRQFLGRLDELAPGPGGRSVWARLAPWGVAAAAATFALELVRRARRQRLAADGAACWPGPDGFPWIGHGC